MEYFLSDATPALLCHNEPAQGTQTPLLEALVRNAPYSGHFLPFAVSLWHKVASMHFKVPNRGGILYLRHLARLMMLNRTCGKAGCNLYQAS